MGFFSQLLLPTALGFAILIVVTATCLLTSFWLHSRRSSNRRSLAEQLIKLHKFPKRYHKLLRILLSAKTFRVEGLVERLSTAEVLAIQKSDIPKKLRLLADKGTKWQRVRSMLLLGLLQDYQSLGLLRQRTLSKDSDEAYAAVSALGRFCDDSSVRFLVSLLSSRYKINGSRVASVLEGIPGEHTDLLLNALEHSDSKARFWSATLLGAYNHNRVRKRLLKACNDTDPNVRAASLDSLGKIGDVSCSEVMITCLADDVWYVRAHAALSCGQCQHLNSITKLIDRLADPVWWVRFDAGRALEIMLRGSHERIVYQALLGNIDVDDQFARNMTASLLSRYGAVNNFVAHFEDSGSEGQHARRLLAFIYDAGGAPELEQNANWQRYYHENREAAR